MVVIVNLGVHDRGDYRLGLPCRGTWRVRLNSNSELYGAMGDNVGPAEIDGIEEAADGLPASASLIIPAYSILVLSQDTAV